MRVSATLVVNRMDIVRDMSGQYNSQWIPMQSPPQYSSQYPSTQSLLKPALGKYTEVAADEHTVPEYRKQSFK